MCDKYQGAANYPTWDIALWIDNEQAAYNYWRGKAAELIEEFKEQKRAYPHEYEQTYRTPRRDATYHLAQALKEEYEEGAQEFLSEARTPASPFHDILTWALGQVDWTEIAESIIDETIEEAE
jgi:hypothetical protein